MKITIFHTNDLHNRFYPLDYLETLSRNSHTLILDAGDAIGGSNTVFRFREPILDKMSAIGYDAMAIGNREFHYLRSVLEGRVSQVNFPLLCSNVVDLKGIINSLILPYIIKNIDGARIAIIGFTPVQFREKSIWKKLTGFQFLEPVEAALKVVSQIKSKVHLIIALSHLGLRDDEKLAREVPQINLIIGGHSHTALKNFVKAGNSFIFQTGCYGNYLGKIDIEFDSESIPAKIKDVRSLLIPVKEKDGK